MTHRWRTPGPRLLIASVAAAILVFLSFELLDLSWFAGTRDPSPRFLLLRGVLAGSVLLLLALARHHVNQSLFTRETLRVLSEHATDGFVAVDAAGCVRETNLAAERMFGYRAGELAGRPVELLMPDRGEQTWQRLLRRWRGSGDLPDPAVPFEVIALRRDGIELPIEVSVASWTVGRQRLLSVVVRDISQRRRTEQQLRESEARFRLLAEHSTDVILRARMDAIVTYVSPAIRALVGYEPEEVVGRSGYEFLDPSESEPAVLAHVGLLEGAGPFRIELRAKRKDGSPLWVEAAGQVVPDEMGALAEVISVVRDVSERREMEEQLRESERRLKQAQAIAALGSWEWNLDTGKILWSDELYRVSGVDPESFVPTPETTLALTHPKDLAALPELAILGEEEVEWQQRIIRPDGQVRWLSVRARRERGPDGSRRLVGTSQDVTGRKLTEEALLSKGRELRLTLENLSDVIAIAAADGTWRYVSSSIERVLGYRPEEFVGTRPPASGWHMIHPEDLPRVREWIRAFRQAGGDPIALELRFRHRDGSWRVLETIGQGLLHEPGIEGLVFTTRDVTRRKEAEAAVIAAERKYRRLFEDSLDAIWMARPDGALIDLNPAGLEMLGYESRNEIDGFQLSPDVLDPETLERALHLVRTRGRLENFECELRLPGERVRKMLVSAMPVTGSDGEIEYLHGITRDVTEHRALESQLRKSQKLEAIGRLAAGVAHEVNNPLTWVLSGLDDLRTNVERMGGRLEPAEAAGLRGTLEEVRLGAERVRRIVRDLHTYGRADGEDRSAVDICGVLRRAVHMTSNEIRFRARLRESLAEMPAVIANEGRLLQVFLNLLINASQALPEGDPGGNEVVVETRREDGLVVVEVRDTGHGIAQENLSRLFDPFFTTKPPGEGSGLGLSISHNIVSAIGGRIDVESRVGAGTRFIVRLPAAPAEAASMAPDPRGRPAHAPEATPRRGARVLLVDDEPLIRAVAGRALRLDHEVVVAAGGLEALAILEQDDRFDAIVCDLMMPGAGGIELYDALRERAPSLARRILFMTGGAFTPAARSFLDRVPNPALEKPFEPPDLLRAVSTLLATTAGNGDP